MTRLRLILIAVPLMAVVIVLALARPFHHRGPQNRFDVIFDNARGLLAGQQIKVAGAVAGEITHLALTPNFQARIEATIAPRFLPFHTDASCEIRPEGLIAENYVECNPGTPGTPLLYGVDGEPPTVPVSHTTEPMNLTDLFNTFNVPTRERAAVLLDELGIATAAQGQNLNAIIQRANPALAQARQAIAILNQEHGQLAGLLSSTDTILVQAAAHRGRLEAVLNSAARLTALTADHASPLSEAVARLPALLRQAGPSLASLSAFTTNATPVVRQLGGAAPELTVFSERLGPFVTAAKPALTAFAATLSQALPALHHTVPVMVTLNRYLSESLPSVRQITQVLQNLQQRGFSEIFLSLVYYLAALSGRYDSISHLAPAYLVNPQGGACDDYATTPVAGCNANYTAAAAAATTTATTASPPPASATPTPARPSGALPSVGGVPTLTLPTATTTGPLNSVAGTLQGVANSASSAGSAAAGGLSGLLSYLLKP